MPSRQRVLFFVMSILGRQAMSFLSCSSRRIPFVKLMQTFDSASFISKSESDMILDPLVVCGPSGVGKGTIIAKYMEEFGGKDRFGFTVSHTTRAPRPGEEEGIHYHFSSHASMQLEIDAGLFLEHAEVHGNLYGTSWSSIKNVQTSGKRCLLDVDVQGVRRLKALQSPTLLPTYIFIAPPSLDALEKRLADRGTESAESLARRTQNARMELEYGLEEGNFDFIVVNDDLEEATYKFSNVIAQIYPDASQC